MAPSFLDLPGELRNRIYELVAVYDDLPKKIKHHKGSVNDHKHTIDSGGTYAGLTRTCRQIRSEYLPTQQKNASVSISYDDLKDFIVAFLVHEHPFERLIIQITDDGPHHSSHIDLLPLLRMGARFPTSSMGCRWMSGQALSDGMLCSWWTFEHILCHSNTHWLAMLSDSACKFHAILWKLSSGDIEIIMKPGNRFIKEEVRRGHPGDLDKLVSFDLTSEHGVQEFLSKHLELDHAMGGLRHPHGKVSVSHRAS